jgi:hypothetical protein
MKPRYVIILSATFLIVVGVSWILIQRQTSVQTKRAVQETRGPRITAITPSSSIPEAVRQLPGAPYQPADPRWAERRKLRREDPQYEWKTPIKFYGRVLDQEGKPVAGATADIVWTDMSPEGSSHMQVTSDGAGLFSITGISGKHMTVRVTKEGYLRETSKGRSAFEFAGFWEPTYYEPDPNNPVIFYLRKKGEPAELVSSEGKLVLTFGIPAPIPMPPATANASPINVTVFESDAKTRKWRARISVDDGGIVPALEEFPFEAPKEGYQSSLDLNEESPHPPGWQDLHEGGWFYIKTRQGYGLLKLRQIRGKKTLRYEVLLNSKGGTNLEPSGLAAAEP